MDSSFIYFVRGARISFFGLLWEHGWMALVALAAAIAIWLWKGLPRFILDHPAARPAPRDFAGHVRMTGKFLWRRRLRPPSSTRCANASCACAGQARAPTTPPARTTRPFTPGRSAAARPESVHHAME
ncbi:MAG: hypothetical protein R3F11_17050 [Verrucomicrobiales bacterium]